MTSKQDLKQKGRSNFLNLKKNQHTINNFNTKSVLYHSENIFDDHYLPSKRDIDKMFALSHYIFKFQLWLLVNIIHPTI